jgi:iron complex outermembrane receptor protein
MITMALVAAMATSPLHAQDETTSGGSPTGSVLVDEITVTATRRETEIKQIPISITAISGEEIEAQRAHTLTEITKQVPGLELGTAFYYTHPSIFLRGVGTNDFNANAVGAVGIYHDEVYDAAPPSQLLHAFDLERVEVLRGPQGTLYGKNTNGGAINLLTRRPGSGGGYARLALGRYDRLDAELASDIPFASDVVTGRVAAFSRNRDGVTENLLTGSDENDVDASGGRFHLRFLPSNRTLVNLNLYGGFNRSGAYQFQQAGLLDGEDFLGYREDPDPFKGSYNRPGVQNEVDAYGGIVTVVHEADQLSLTSITALGDTENEIFEDSDGSPNQVFENDFTSDASQFSQEVRLASNSGDDGNWLAGVYYFDQDLDSLQRYDLFRELRPFYGFDPDMGIFLLRQNYTQETSSWAVFGQTERQLTPELVLGVGVRYTDEDKDFRTSTAFVEPEFEIPVLDDVRQSANAGEWSGDVRLRWQASPGIGLFAGIARGFKAPAFNGAGLFDPAEVEPTEPEFLTSGEIGVKSSLAGNRVRLDATVFIYDYQDLQVFTLRNVGGVPIPVLDNASDADLTGLDLEMRASPGRDWRLRIGGTLLDATYEDYQLGDLALSGNQLINAPDFTVNAAVEWFHRLDDRGALLAYAGYNYKDAVFYDTLNNPRLRQGGYGLVDARVGYESASGRWGIAAWGLNLTDKVYRTDILDLADFGFDIQLIGDPTTYGVDASFRWR